MGINTNTNRRLVTSTGTIPAGSNATGTITTNAIDDTLLDVAGSSRETLLSECQGTNLWLYVPSTNAIRKIEGVSGPTQIKVSTSLAGVTGLAFQIIRGVLSSWSVKNTGGAAGELDGVTMAADSVDNASSTEYPVLKVLDVITFDASGTAFEITEITG